MLKKLTYLIVLLYLTVLYGQNIFEFGSSFRADFYFIGMALVQSLVAFVLFKSFKNIVTSYFLFMCVGSFVNELYFNGSISYIEIVFGIIGVIYILTENNIKKWKG